MNLKTITILCLSLALASCDKEDETLLTEYEHQKEVIEDLEFQIHRLNKKVTENHIPDPTDKIDELNTKLETLETQKNALLEEIAQAAAETKKASDKLKQYKLDYPIKTLPSNANQ